MRKHEKYKDSEVEWLGEIPEHWEVKRVKDIFTLERGKFTHRPRNDQRMYVNGTHPFIQTGDVSRSNKYVTTYKQTLNEEGIKVSRKFNSGTIVMTIAANIGDVAILDFDCYFPDSLVAFPTKYCVDYFYYLLAADKPSLDNVKVTNTQDNLNLERLRGLEKISPPLQEQTQIANYLDQKTQAIDKKIALLQQKIRYYQEFKKSLINETVCRGLDKNVKLKDSGVEWIGEIPEHWEVFRLKDIVNLKFSNVDKKTKEGQKDVFLCNYVDVYKNDFISNDMQFMKATASQAEIKKFSLKYGDIMFTKDSESFDDIANSAIVIEQLDNVICGYHLGLISTDKTKLNPFYLNRLFQSQNYNYWFTVNATGITRVGLGIGAIQDANTPIPLIEEQEQIANYLDQKTSTINKIISNLESQTNYLAELRKTLINDVVTGKIKVV